jgi:hypothetical protein
MKIITCVAIVASLLAVSAFGQTSQALKRARELNNQNNVRQGVPPTTTPQRPAAPVAPAVAKPATPAPPATPLQAIARIQADIAALKPGKPATAEQKQQLIRDLSAAARGANKPSLPTVTTFANGLIAVLTDKSLGAPEQARLAQNIESVLNSGSMAQKQYDAVIDDVQAILRVGGAKRPQAMEAANQLKAVGAEVRKK